MSNFLPLSRVLRGARHVAWWHSRKRDVWKHVWRHRTSSVKWQRWQGTQVWARSSAGSCWCEDRSGVARKQLPRQYLQRNLTQIDSSAYPGLCKHPRDAGRVLLLSITAVLAELWTEILNWRRLKASLERAFKLLMSLIFYRPFQEQTGLSGEAEAKCIYQHINN